MDLIGDSDVDGKNEWDALRGALILPNIGDTGRRCSKLALSGPPLSNEMLDDCNDASDEIQRAPQFLAPLKTVPLPNLAADFTGTVSVLDTAKENVRIFRRLGPEWLFTAADHIFSAEELEAGLDLGIDARDTRRPDGWDGLATIRLTLSGAEGSTTDDVQVRVAPVLIHHHLQPVEQVLAVKGNATESPWIEKYVRDLSAAVNDAGLETALYLFDGSDDIWAQDFMEPGFASIPGPDGPIRVRIMVRSPQDERVAGRQLFEYYRQAGVGAVQHLGGARDEINSAGNIETVPPHTANGKTWPAGRVILGDHGEQQHHILPYLRAQEVQEPILLDTDWLVIGHVDEFLQFLPVDNARGWAVMVDDPRLAIKLLEELQVEGHGSLPAISRKNDTQNGPGDCDGWGCDPIPVTPPTIDQILEDQDLLLVNSQCAERIDANIEILKAEVGLTDGDFFRISAMFEQSRWGGDDGDGKLQVGALFPGVINNLVLTGFNTCVAPNPWGPTPNGTDVLATAILAEYAKLDIDIQFIDDWNSHHNYGGEVHCGSNSIRSMSDIWW